MKKALMKDTIKEITQNFKRFISILLIVLLGVGFFAGIKATSPDMRKTIDKYFDDENVMDIQVLSTLGLVEDDFEALENVEGVENIEASYSTDAIVNGDDKEVVVKLMSAPKDINKLTLVEGKLPESNNECVVEPNFLLGTEYKIGDKITIDVEDIQNEDGEDQALLKETEVTIVGTVRSPLYISSDRGSTKLGSGKINYYMYIPLENFDTDIRTEAYITVAGAKDLKTYNKNYEDTVQDVQDRIEEISEERRQERYQEIYDEANKKIEDGQKELDEQKEKAYKEISNAEKQIEDAKKEVENGWVELQNQKASTQSQLAQAKKQLDEADEELTSQEKLFEEEKRVAETEISQAKTQLETLENVQKQYNTLNATLTTLNNSLKALNSQLEVETDAEKIEEIKIQITKLQAQITQINTGIETIKAELEKQGIKLESLDKTINSIKEQISSGEEELESAEQELKKARTTLNTQIKNYEANKKSADSGFASAEAELSNAEKEIKENEEKLEDEKKKAEEEIKKAQEELDDAKVELEQIEKPDWYILDRDTNVGYVSYLQETDRIENIAAVFPIVFFIVAALISLTSMTRMIEEQRVQIGTLKALGYRKRQIASKYIIYATVSTIVGGLIGMSIGFYLIPKVISDMYGMMYILPPTILEFNIEYAIFGMVAAGLCTIGSTIYSSVRTLRNTPASLMRPKAPKPGKRVFLEKIPFIWKHLNFTQKVTARNVFRYKKRFLMTIIGVTGCTSLIVAGFGLRNAVDSMIPAQYGEIFKYDIQMTLKDGLKQKEIQKAYDKIVNTAEIKNTLKAEMQSVEIVKNDNNQDIQLIVPEDISNLSNFIDLRDRKDKEKTYTLDEQGIIITEKLATLLDIKVGDTVTIKNADDEEVNARVSAITENYLYHYMYMSPELYKNLYNEDMRPNTILALTDDLSEEQEDALGKQILQDDNIASIVFTSVSEGIFEDVMNNMTVVVWILIIAAGLLVLVVLYNLSNTNISERIRELATIKVLGFYDKEVYDYVGHETIILTAIGILVGLIGGNFLTTFIIKTCELDILMFNPYIPASCYIYGILITAVFALIVNITTYFTLKKINMIESLKSVE